MMRRAGRRARLPARANKGVLGGSRARTMGIIDGAARASAFRGIHRAAEQVTRCHAMAGVQGNADTTGHAHPSMCAGVVAR